jgi:hypothetical protein
MKQDLIKKFEDYLKNEIRDKIIVKPIGIESWDRNKMDIADKEFTLIRVVSEGGKYFIKRWVSTNVFDDYEITQQEFNNLQQCYFGDGKK